MKALWIKIGIKNINGSIIINNIYQWKDIVNLDEIIDLNKVIWLG